MECQIKKMSNRVKISDLRFISQKKIFPSALESNRNIVKRFVKISMVDVHLFSITVEWMSKHSHNLGNKRLLVEELNQQVNFEEQMIELDESIDNKNLLLERLSELHKIIRQIVMMKRKYYRLIRSFFLESITYKYVSIKHNVRPRNLFHEPIIFAKRKPLIATSQSDSHKYRPSKVTVDFALKKTDDGPGLFLYECKASLAEFFKSIDENTDRAKSALRKVDYILAVRNAFSSKIRNSNQYNFEAVMTTYVDSPDYDKKDKLGFPKIIKPINVNLIKSLLFRFEKLN